ADEQGARDDRERRGGGRAAGPNHALQPGRRAADRDGHEAGPRAVAGVPPRAPRRAPDVDRGGRAAALAHRVLPAERGGPARAAPVLELSAPPSRGGESPRRGGG